MIVLKAVTASCLDQLLGKGTWYLQVHRSVQFSAAAKDAYFDVS